MTDAAKDFRDKQNEKKLSKLKLFENIGLLSIVGLALLSLLFSYLLFFGPGPKAKSGKETNFTVDQGDGIKKVADHLHEENLVRVEGAFKFIASLNGANDKLKAGEYAIPSGASPSKILKILIGGKVITHKVTIPEGWSNAMVFDKLMNNDYLTGDIPENIPEGALAPDTYQIKKGETRQQIINRMISEQNNIVDKLWIERDANLPLRSKQEAVTMASIVEKETGIASERRKIAAVFMNRLKNGIRLQSDPTIIYGITKGKPLGRKILKSEITENHPWNTYVIQGLPPTPIANPGKDAIDAVLHPATTNDMFFVADGSGGHAFSSTYDEHEKNVQKWREFRAQKESMNAVGDSNLAGATK